jgi:hypothetical protein
MQMVKLVVLTLLAITSMVILSSNTGILGMFKALFPE